MRKLDPIKGDALEFINAIISSSRKAGESRKERQQKTKMLHDVCSVIVCNNKQIINQYDGDFKENALERLENKGELSDDEKDDFLSLYSYKKKQIKQLRYAVLTENGYRNDICPLCECDSVATMDHYLPKEKYPLFVVHPRNLIPCCNSCNQHKSDNVFKDGKRVFWNCYLDSPINTRYLYCTISSKDGLIAGEFSIDTRNLPEQEASVIENTMNKDGQSVLSQYNKKVGNEIKELIKRISNRMLDGDGFDEIIKKIKDLDLSKNILNDWKDVLKDALLNSAVFLNFAKDESEKFVRETQKVNHTI